MRPLILAICLLSATACSSKSPTGPTIPLDQQFTLAAGGSATLDDSSLRLQFLQVTGDSRCPADAFCIQGGDATVHVRVSGGGTLRTLELHTGDASRAAATHGDHRITLVDLQPYPFSSLPPIAPGDYRATLRVTRP
jgi:hypothetical protein